MAMLHSIEMFHVVRVSRTLSMNSIYTICTSKINGNGGIYKRLYSIWYAHSKGAMPCYLLKLAAAAGWCCFDTDDVVAAGAPTIIIKNRNHVLMANGVGRNKFIVTFNVFLAIHKIQPFYSIYTTLHTVRIMLYIYNKHVVIVSCAELRFILLEICCNEEFWHKLTHKHTQKQTQHRYP